MEREDGYILIEGRWVGKASPRFGGLAFNSHRFDSHRFDSHRFAMPSRHNLTDEDLLDLIEKERSTFSSDYVTLPHEKLDALKKCSNLVVIDRNSISRNTRKLRAQLSLQISGHIFTMPIGYKSNKDWHFRIETISANFKAGGSLLTDSISITMSIFSVDNILEPDLQYLCNVCQNISFDRFVEEGTIKHGVFKEIRHKSSHCVLCRLIFQKVKKSIVDSSVPEADVEGYIAAVEPSAIALRFSMSAENNDWLHIDVGPPSLMIDGWLPFGESNSLRLFCQPGELYLFRLLSSLLFFFFYCKRA